MTCCQPFAQSALPVPDKCTHPACRRESSRARDAHRRPAPARAAVSGKVLSSRTPTPRAGRAPELALLPRAFAPSSSVRGRALPVTRSEKALSFVRPRLLHMLPGRFLESRRNRSRVAAGTASRHPARSAFRLRCLSWSFQCCPAPATSSSTRAAPANPS